MLFRAVYLLVFSIGLFPYFGKSQILIEAENGSWDGAQTSTVRPGFSGSGYLSGINSAGDFCQINFEIVSVGEYQIEVVYASTSLANSAAILSVNNIPTEIRFTQSSSFTVVNTGIFSFEKGGHTLKIQFIQAELDIDFFRVTKSTDWPPIPVMEDVVRLEAEDGLLTGTRMEYGTPGYSGRGYVSNFTSPGVDKLKMLINVAEAGDYQLKIGFATPFGYKENYLSVNSKPNITVKFEESQTFTEVSVGKINLLEGVNTLEMTHFWGWFELDYLEVSRIIGQPPQAKSQGHLVLHDLDNDGFETVSLDASASVDPDGQILFYHWRFADGDSLSSGAITEVSLPVGSHTLRLTVTDDVGNEGKHDFFVVITDPDSQKHHRLPIRLGSDSLFMSGINLAWTASGNFAKDLQNFQEGAWTTILDAIARSGANALRWWLHTNGSVSPQFGGDGKVSGLGPQNVEILRQVLDMAYERGMLVSLCLWSFDMLQNQGQNLAYTRALLEDTVATRAYIERALIPMVEAIGHHPAIMTWEIFNEPEGMTEEFGWSHERTQMIHVQRFINLCAGAIHRTVPGALVSNGSWSFLASTDIRDFMDFYRDDRLISAGGDPDGTLDFIQVHYYGHFGLSASPFFHPASHWNIDKPILIGEFPANGIDGLSTRECYDFAYRLGYAGALAWSYSDNQFGGLPAASPGINWLKENYEEDITVRDTGNVVRTENPGWLTVHCYPNPVLTDLYLDWPDKKEGEYPYSIYDPFGRMISRGIVSNWSETTSIDVENLPSGSYILQIRDSQKWRTARFVKI